jgi:predicted amidohydrolase
MASAVCREPIHCPTARPLANRAKLAAIAAANDVHVLAGIATRESASGTRVYRNSALLFGPDGALIAHYRKQRLFSVGGEDLAYQPGEQTVTAEIGGVRFGIFICYDLRFPELFRPLAPHVDAMVLIASWPKVRRPHWDVLIQARAIENQCYFVAVTRVGVGGGVEHDGGSAVYGPWGECIANAGESDAATADIACVTLDSEEVTRVRERFPFVQDRRAFALV